MTISPHRLMLTTVLCIVVLGGTGACGDDRGSLTEPSGRVGNWFTADGDPSQTATSKPTERESTTSPTETTTSKSAAGSNHSVDPCAVSWTDFPASVRPADPAAKGLPTRPREGEPFVAACTYSNSTQADGSPDKPTGPGAFAARILWSLNLDTTKMAKGATPKTWGGRVGGLQAYGGKDGAGCLGYMAVGAGHVAVQLLNNRFPSADACGMVDGLMTAFAVKIK